MENILILHQVHRPSPLHTTKPPTQLLDIQPKVRTEESEHEQSVQEVRKSINGI